MTYSRSFRADIWVSGLYDLYDLAHISGQEPCHLYDLQWDVFPGLSMYYVQILRNIS